MRQNRSEGETPWGRLWGTLKIPSTAVAWQTSESHLLPGKSLPLFLFVINASESRSLVQRKGSCCEMVTCKRGINCYTGDERNQMLKTVG